MNLYLISDLARETGLHRYTIDYYMKENLIKEESRTAGNYRVFNDETLSRLRRIVELRSADFSIREIRSMLEGS